MISSRLSISCLADTRKFLDAYQLILSDGVVSLDHDDRKTSRQKKLAEQGFPADLAVYKDAAELSALTGLPLSGLACILKQVRLSARNNLPSIWRHLCRAFMAQSLSLCQDRQETGWHNVRMVGGLQQIILCFVPGRICRLCCSL